MQDRVDIPPCWNEISPYKGMYVQKDGTWRKSEPYKEILRAAKAAAATVASGSKAPATG